MSSNNPLDYIYDLDTSGSNPANKVLNELHVVTAAIETGDFNVIVPKSGPYFLESMRVYHVSSGVELTPGIDWTPGHIFESATYETESIRGGIYGSILIMNRALTGQFRLTEYQTLGAGWVLNHDRALEILAARAIDPRTMTLEQVNGLPEVFPPTGHNHPIQDYTGYSEMVISNNRIALAIEEQTATWLDNPPILMSQYYLKDEMDILMGDLNTSIRADLTLMINQTNQSVNSLSSTVQTGLNSRYTKTESDGRYYQKYQTYSRAEVDLLVSGVVDSAYTKSESDSRYYLRSQTYSRTEMDGRYVPLTRQIGPGTGLAGGGNLTANRTLEIAPGYTPATAISLGNTENLNDLKTPLYYRQSANANASLSRNYPIAEAGSLEILPAAGVIQRYTTYLSGRVYIRTFYDNVWSAWRLQIDQTIIRWTGTALYSDTAGGQVYPAVWQG